MTEKKSSLAKGWFKYFMREWVFGAIIPAAFLAFGIVRPFIIEPYKIPTGSMRPTLLEGDLILVNKFIYGARVPFTDFYLPKVREPKRGDVIVFIYPEDPKKNFIKRLVGLPGDSVEIKEGLIYVNGQPLRESKFTQNVDGTLREYYNKGKLGQEEEKILVPPDSLFVLGDNSGSSLDSRFWGFVPRKNLRGQAMIIWWPPNRIRLIK